jgi:1,5-anhydro-D-fructose reductase (1,5-anhydro-D-mannitol-forming)
MQRNPTFLIVCSHVDGLHLDVVVIALIVRGVQVPWPSTLLFKESFRMLNLALLGTGRIAETQLAPALAATAGVQLWSVLSRSPERASDFATRHGAASPTPGYTSLDELVKDTGLHGVIVATPDRLHAQQAITASRAGKHVFIEKPMATSAEEGASIVAECEAAAVVLGVAYHLRWHGGHRLVADAVRAGELGELRHMRVQWSLLAPDAGNWRASPEVGRWWSLAGVGTHCLDLIRWFMKPSCGEVEAVSSVISRSVWRGPHDETAVAVLRFESGATAEFCSSVQFAAPSRVEVYGSAGYAVCEGTLGAHGLGTVRDQNGERRFTPVNPFEGELLDFAAAVGEGRPPEVDGGEGLRNVELLVRIASSP